MGRVSPAPSVRSAGNSRQISPVSIVGQYLQTAGMSADMRFQEEMKRVEMEDEAREAKERREEEERKEARPFEMRRLEIEAEARRELREDKIREDTWQPHEKPERRLRG